MTIRRKQKLRSHVQRGTSEPGMEAVMEAVKGESRRDWFIVTDVTG